VGGRDILGFRPGIDDSLIPLVGSEDFEEAAPALSRNERWLAYSSNETGRTEVYVRPFPVDDSTPILVSRVGGRSPVWAHSGSELFFVEPDGGMIALAVDTGAEFGVLGRERLFTRPPGAGLAPHLATEFEVSLDDQRFLMVRSLSSTGGGSRVNVVLNFFEVLKERVGN